MTDIANLVRANETQRERVPLENDLLVTTQQRWR